MGGGTGVHFGARPPWDWVLGFAREFLPLPKGVELLQAIRRDLVTNMMTNPVALVHYPHIVLTKAAVEALEARFK